MTHPPPQLSWATLRPLVEPAFADRITWAHVDHLKGKARLVVASVEAVTEQQVLLSAVDGSSSQSPVPYDYLVVATGSSNAGAPAARARGGGHSALQARRAAFAAEAKILAEAQSVLIVGGGPTGVELAGEILTDQPNKKAGISRIWLVRRTHPDTPLPHQVTIVHSGTALLHGAGVPDAINDKVGVA